MSDVLTAVVAAVLVGSCALGAGSLLCGGARTWSPPRRWLLRLLFGLAVVPLAQVAAHELLGWPVHPAPALALGVGGLALAAAQEWRWRGRADRGGPASELLVVAAAGLGLAALAGLLGQAGFDGLDPWRHAFGATWLAESGSLRQPDPGFPLIHYVDAYPPLFEVLLALPVALLGVTGPAVKGVAALLVAAAPPALWLVARSLLGDGRRALIASGLYLLTPAAVPRHLWGHSLALVLTLAGLTAALELRHDPRWWPALAAAAGGTVLAAPSLGIKAGLVLAATTAVAASIDRRWALRLVLGGLAAVAVSALWLGPATARAGFRPTTLIRQMQPPELRRGDDPVSALPAGEAPPLPWADKAHDRVAPANLLFFRPHPWLLRLTGDLRVSPLLPAGLGLPLALLALAGLWPGSRGDGPERWRLTGAWLAVTGVLALGAPLGVVLFNWRSWLLLAPCAALAAVPGLERVLAWPRGARIAVLVAALAQAVAALHFDLGHGLVSVFAYPAWLVVTVAVAVAWHRALAGASRQALALALLAAHLVVAGPVRAATLLHEIPPRVFYDRVEHHAYLELAAELPRGERVWPLSGGLRFDILTALDLGCTPWRTGELAMARRCSRGEPPAADELVAWMAEHDYPWLVADPSLGELLRARGDDRSEALVDALDAHPGLRRRVGDTEAFAVWQRRP